MHSDSQEYSMQICHRGGSGRVRRRISLFRAARCFTARRRKTQSESTERQVAEYSQFLKDSGKRNSLLTAGSYCAGR